MATARARPAASGPIAPGAAWPSGPRSRWRGSAPWRPTRRPGRCPPLAALRPGCGPETACRLSPPSTPPRGGFGLDAQAGRHQRGHRPDGERGHRDHLGGRVRRQSPPAAPDPVRPRPAGLPAAPRWPVPPAGATGRPESAATHRQPSGRHRPPPPRGAPRPGWRIASTARARPRTTGLGRPAPPGRRRPGPAGPAAGPPPRADRPTARLAPPATPPPPPARPAGAPPRTRTRVPARRRPRGTRKPSRPAAHGPPPAARSCRSRPAPPPPSAPPWPCCARCRHHRMRSSSRSAPATGHRGRPGPNHHPP